MDPIAFVDSLSPLQRSVLAANLFDGMTQRQIADRDGVTLAAVRQTIKRARTKGRRYGVPIPQRGKALHLPCYSLTATDPV